MRTAHDENHKVRTRQVFGSHDVNLNVKAGLETHHASAEGGSSRRGDNEKSPGGQAEARCLSLDSNCRGVKPRNVARISLSRHRSPRRTGGPRTPVRGFSRMSLKEGDYWATDE